MAGQSALFMGIGKLTQKGAHTLPVAARHNKRQGAYRKTGTIDPKRTHLNVRLAGPSTAEGVIEAAHTLMLQAGIKKPRANGVTAIELVFSLPPNPGIDPIAYFTDCTSWAEAHFECKVLASDVHLDEAAPHCHVLLFPPVVNGRLNGAAAVGYGSKFAEHRRAFFTVVGRRWGLKSGIEKLPAAMTGRAVDAVVAELRRRDDPAQQSAVWPQLRSAIVSNPLPFLEALQIAQPERRRKQRSFTQIMTSKGKGPKWEPEFSCVAAADLPIENSRIRANPAPQPVSDASLGEASHARPAFPARHPAGRPHDIDRIASPA